MINRVCLAGNLGSDAELRWTQGGTPVLNFSIAVSERRKNNQTGGYDDYTNWFDCVLFGNRAEKVSQYLTKGTKVCVEGHLRFSSWERDGNKRSKVDVIVEELEFMSRNQGGGQGGGQGYQGSQGGYQQAQTPQTQQPEPFYYGTSDVPF